jgi:signal transduction histidine kinase
MNYATSYDVEYICFAEPMASLQAFILPCMKKLFFTKALMIAVVLLIALFEAYWLTKLYKDEYNVLKKEADVTFRETIFKLQRNQFEKDTVLFGKKDTILFSRNMNAKSKSGIGYNESYVITGKPRTKFIIGKDSASIRKALFAKGMENLATSLPSLMQIVIRKNYDKNDSSLPLNIDSTISNTSKDSSGTKVSKIFFNHFKDSSILKRIKAKDITSISFVSQYNVKSDSLDSTKQKKLKIEVSLKPVNKTVIKPVKTIIDSFFTTNKFFNDSIPPATVDSAYKKELSNLKRNIPYSILFKAGDSSKATINAEAKDTGNNFITSTILTGFKTPYTYTALFSKVPHYLLGKMQMQIIGSALLLLIVTVAFWALYYNLNEQRKLAAIKNEFISNITHELKTPIATVTVAIEALQRFNAMDNPERTQSYLNISAAELQRLSLLVDKVLKLSMFENKSIELNKEWMDVEALINEVMSSMKLQFDKQKAVVNLHTDGNSFVINADKLHIASVVYNLLDNALKYSKNIPEITISLVHHETYIDLIVQDNGIGISKAYKDKVFEKFFRVPTEDRHNIKGYGLGLSYVSHIAGSHQGFITVDTQLGKGSIFTVKLPVKETDTIDYGNGRKMIKR